MDETLRLRHRIEYTRNKHSRAVCRGDTIVIRLARRLTKAEEEEHIRNLLTRMTRVVLRERKKMPIDPFRAILDGEKTVKVRPASGQCYLFTLTPGQRTGVRPALGGFELQISPTLRRRALHRLLWSLLAKAELNRVRALVERINAETFRERLRDVRVRFATSQWGSCSRQGVVMLNAALLFLPPRLLEYVIIHELAHRRVANHSTAYWRLVESALPRYRDSYHELRGYRLPQA